MFGWCRVMVDYHIPVERYECGTWVLYVHLSPEVVRFAEGKLGFMYTSI